MEISDDYDDEDTSNDDEFALGQLGQFSMLEDGFDEIIGDYFTWDLLLKNVYKLPSPETFAARIRHGEFYSCNKWQYNVPFLIFFNDLADVPQTFEL